MICMFIILSHSSYTLHVFTNKVFLTMGENCWINDVVISKILRNVGERAPELQGLGT